MNEATITVPNAIPIDRHIFCDGYHWLYIKIDNDESGGWEHVKPLTRKVLRFEGRDYTYRCWNSDNMYCVFTTHGKYATIK